MMKDLLPEIRHDLRKWRAGDALDTDREDNIFEPNTVAFLAVRYPGLNVEPWNAESVIDQVIDRVLADTHDSGDLAVLECFRKGEIKRRNVKAAESRRANELKSGKLPPMQQAVFAAEKDLAKKAPDHVPDHYILQWLLFDAPIGRRWAGATLFNVQRARKALRAKGL